MKNVTSIRVSGSVRTWALGLNSKNSLASSGANSHVRMCFIPFFKKKDLLAIILNTLYRFSFILRCLLPVPISVVFSSGILPGHDLGLLGAVFCSSGFLGSLFVSRTIRFSTRVAGNRPFAPENFKKCLNRAPPVCAKNKNVYFYR